MAAAVATNDVKAMTPSMTHSTAAGCHAQTCALPRRPHGITAATRLSMRCTHDISHPWVVHGHSAASLPAPHALPTARCCTGLVYRHLASPLLPPALSLLRHLAAPAHSQQGCSRASMALLRMLRSVIDVLGLELGAGGLEQLLGGLVEALGQAGDGRSERR